MHYLLVGDVGVLSALIEAFSESACVEEEDEERVFKLSLLLYVGGVRLSLDNPGLAPDEQVALL